MKKSHRDKNQKLHGLKSDANTNIFHAVANRRKNRNLIEKVRKMEV